MNSITANELKTKGVTVVESALSNSEEAIITVRGKQKYVIIEMEKYDKLRDYELEIALLEATRDVAEGRVNTESVDEHIERLKE
ncbi:MAG: type II toxin-antitoxin system Phd/YefM family antitoxin [Immundisolibacteraceae bacterium]|nr:type II toxin-antitoxin system Phd/YefM family antitoxin [Immundisolibacteraceae bacterium]